jgi:hypothetical protein
MRKPINAHQISSGQLAKAAFLAAEAFMAEVEQRRAPSPEVVAQAKREEHQRSEQAVEARRKREILSRGPAARHSRGEGPVRRT